MNESIWVSKEVVFSIQDDLLARFGVLPGVRDEGLLLSALNRPLQLFHYGHSILFDMAAAYASGIVKNHPFLDGNKRAGFMTAYVFLGVNGIEIDATEEGVVVQTLALAASGIEEAGYARWLKEVSVKASL